MLWLLQPGVDVWSWRPSTQYPVPRARSVYQLQQRLECFAEYIPEDRNDNFSMNPTQGCRWSTSLPKGYKCLRSRWDYSHYESRRRSLQYSGLEADEENWEGTVMSGWDWVKDRLCVCQIRHQGGRSPNIGWESINWCSSDMVKIRASKKVRLRTFIQITKSINLEDLGFACLSACFFASGINS